MTDTASKSSFSSFFNENRTHFYVILAGIVILAFYFLPVLFQGKQIVGHDHYQSFAMRKEMSDYKEKTGEQILWSNTQFGGMPMFQTGVQYTSNLFSPITKLVRMLLPYPFIPFVLMFVGFYFLAFHFTKNHWLSGIGAIGFTFSSYFLILVDAGHSSKLIAITYYTFIILGCILVYEGRYFLGFLLTSLFTCLEVGANHFQITYYLLFVLIALGINEFVKAVYNKTLPGFGKSTAILLLAAFLGVGPNIANLWTTMEYGEETMRGKSELKNAKKSNKSGGLEKDYALKWSYGIAETFTFMFPNSYGGASSYNVGVNSETYNVLKKTVGSSKAKGLVKSWPTYYGVQPFTSGSVYIGSIFCFLFILGLLIVPNTIRWWLLGVTVFTVFLSWGKNFPFLTNLFFDHFPLYNKFRAVSMLLVVAELTIPFLGIIALNKFLTSPKEKRDELLKALYISLGITGGLSLIFALLPGMVYEFLSFSDTFAADSQKLAGMFRQEAGSPLVADFASALEADRIGMISKDGLSALVLILMTGGLLYAFITDKVKKTSVYAGLLVLVFIDIVPVAWTYINHDSFSKKKGKSSYFNFSRASHFKPTPQDLEILKDKDPNFRVFNLVSNTYNEANTSYYHKSIGGYHAAKLRRYQDLINSHLSGKINEKVVNMLNTKYVIVNRQKPQVQRNPLAAGNAWFISKVKWVTDPDEELNALGEKDFNPKESIIIDQRWKEQLGSMAPSPDSLASIKLTNYHPMVMTYQSNSSKNQVAVFSEIYYNSGKGWNAYIDGNPVPHFRCNYVLRGMEIPAGNHTIEFKFEPKSFEIGSNISLIMSLLLYGSIFFCGYMIWKPRSGSTEE